MSLDPRMLHPSPVVKVRQQGPNGSRVVRIPQDEVFRIRSIFEDHDYRIPPQYLPSGPLKVVDIGANVGLFALYMKGLRQACDIFCFEPVPQTIELLELNTVDEQGIHIFPYALSNFEETAELHLHPANSGENSLKPNGSMRADAIPVPVKDAGNVLRRIGLNYIDILKIDTEGSEVEILKSLRLYLPYIGILMIEFHSEEDRRSIDRQLDTHLLFDANICEPRLGIVKYINARLI